MSRTPQTDQPKDRSRREALRRLAGAVVAAYVVPEIVLLSAARAEDSSSSPSSATTPTAPTAPTAPSAPSTPAPSAPENESGADRGNNVTNSNPRDTCNLPASQKENAISISRSDLARSQEAVEAGYAKPLDQIWGRFVSSYDGRIIGVEFTGEARAPLYRFRAISKRGRLETVTISAQTGEILRIVGC